GAQVLTATTGDKIVSFSEKGVDTAVIYLMSHGRTVAYQVRQHAVVKDMDENTYVGSIASSLGAPAVTDCKLSIATGQKECHYTWWAADILRLELTVRPEADQALGVSSVLIDTRQEGRLRRQAGR
ncbi:MAG: hypothetical protein HQL36_05910, partial [Alphaproteobacteria bacterium]|nr:hypothetical protein [Alphaproteobacteria bacterium]